jgi:hypothetical protein
MQTDYATLVADAVADVEAGNRHQCNTTQARREASGCPRCLGGLARGMDIGIERVEVFRSGVIRLTTAGHGQGRCTVALRNIEVTIHE